MRVYKQPRITGESGTLSNAAPSAHLKYYGGRVISNVQIVQVLYGSGTYASQVQSTNTPSLASMYGGVTNSPYFDWLNTEYNTNITPVTGGSGTNQTIGRGTFLTQVQITPSPANSGSTVDDSQIQAEIAAQIQAGHLPAPSYDSGGNMNTIYMVNFPHGVAVTEGGTTSCASGGFCAYHGTFTLGGKSTYYGVLPDMGAGSGCDVGCGTGTQFANQCSTASHVSSCDAVEH